MAGCVKGGGNDTGHCGTQRIAHTSFASDLLFSYASLFFISGYFEKDKYDLFRAVLIKRGERLIYPYFAYGGLIIIYNTIYYYSTAGNMAKQILKRVIALIYGNFVFENNYAYIGTLWFLVASFCVSILFYWFYRTKNKWKYSIGVITIGFVETWTEKKLHFRLPWCFDIAMVAFSFSIAGYLFKEYKEKVSNRKIQLYGGIILGITGVFGGCLNTQYMIAKGYDIARTDMLYLNWGCVPLFLFSGISISISVTLIAQFIFSRYHILMLEYIGRNSLNIMAVHLYIIQIISRVSRKMNFPAKSWVIFLVTTFLSIAASWIIEKYFPCLNDCAKLKAFIKCKERKEDT